MENNYVAQKLESKPTQCERLMGYIEQYGSISTMEAIMRLGIVNPSARVTELRQKGVKIKTTMTKGQNRFDEPCCYAVYSFKTEDEETPTGGGAQDKKGQNEELFVDLTDEQAHVLTKAILAHFKREQLPIMDAAVSAAFNEVIKQRGNRNERKLGA